MGGGLSKQPSQDRDVISAAVAAAKRKARRLRWRNYNQTLVDLGDLRRAAVTSRAVATSMATQISTAIEAALKRRIKEEKARARQAARQAREKKIAKVTADLKSNGTGPAHKKSSLRPPTSTNADRGEAGSPSFIRDFPGSETQRSVGGVSAGNGGRCDEEVFKELDYIRDQQTPKLRSSF